jgi:hypothetical protein
MSSESIVDYKGYKIKLQFKRFSGGRSTIFKPVEKKWYSLRDDNWNFINPDELLQRAKNYIDNFPERLELRLQKLLTTRAKTVPLNTA